MGHAGCSFQWAATAADHLGCPERLIAEKWGKERARGAAHFPRLSATAFFVAQCSAIIPATQTVSWQYGGGGGQGHAKPEHPGAAAGPGAQADGDPGHRCARCARGCLLGCRMAWRAAPVAAHLPSPPLRLPSPTSLASASCRHGWLWQDHLHAVPECAPARTAAAGLHHQSGPGGELAAGQLAAQP